MSNDDRVATLERLLDKQLRLRNARKQFCGVIPLVVRDGYITSCMYVPCDRVPQYQEMASMGRTRATCPDYADGTCEFSMVCRAGPAVDPTAATVQP
ncbi:MAG: hypothetical protein WBZ31_10420 [Thiobacillus sp.]